VKPLPAVVVRIPSDIRCGSSASCVAVCAFDDVSVAYSREKPIEGRRAAWEDYWQFWSSLLVGRHEPSVRAGDSRLALPVPCGDAAGASAALVAWA